MDIRYKANRYQSPLVKGKDGYYIEISEETMENWVNETDSSKLDSECFSIWIHFENEDVPLPEDVYWNDNGFLMVPVKAILETCEYCGGRGHYVNPNIDSNGLTAEDFADDPDFEEAYFGGTFDIRCAACKGSGELKTPFYYRYKTLLQYVDREQDYEDDYEYERYGYMDY